MEGPVLLAVLAQRVAALCHCVYCVMLREMWWRELLQEMLHEREKRLPRQQGWERQAAAVQKLDALCCCVYCARQERRRGMRGSGQRWKRERLSRRGREFQRRPVWGTAVLLEGR